MRFEVEYYDELASGAEWKPVGVADVTGDQADAQAVGELAELTGFYRARLEAAPEASWAWFRVDLHGETGETIVERSEIPPAF